MTKVNIWWNIINSAAITILYFVFLFSYGEFPVIKNRITTVENKVEQIDYHLQCPVSNKDTIIINYYQQALTKKK